MAYLYLSDGGPDAPDYSSNYFKFNESDPQVLDRLFHALYGKNQDDPEVRSLVESICKSSCSDNKRPNPAPGFLIDWIHVFLEKINRFISVTVKPECPSSVGMGNESAAHYRMYTDKPAA